jgi:hypothetical protein
MVTKACPPLGRGYQRQTRALGSTFEGPIDAECSLFLSFVGRSFLEFAELLKGRRRRSVKAESRKNWKTAIVELRGTRITRYSSTKPSS